MGILDHLLVTVSVTE